MLSWKKRPVIAAWPIWVIVPFMISVSGRLIMLVAWTLGFLGLTAGTIPGSTADAVTLRDGTLVLGEVLDPSSRGKLLMVVRRAWAESELPDRAKTWRAAEAPWMKRARAERLARLEAWRRERSMALGGDAAPEDSILRWLDGEIEHLKRIGPDDDLPRLMMVALDPRDVKSVAKRPNAESRLLRLGWRANFENVETMPANDLKSALEGRNFDVNSNAPVAIDDLLPTPIENETRWRARRAATEVLQDNGLRLIRYQGLVLPEGTPGEAIDATAALSGLVGSLLGDQPAIDPLLARLRGFAAKGNVGAVVTSLEMAPDFSSVRVETTLLVRTGPDRWQPAATRASTIRPDQLQPNAGEPLTADPQVKAVFGLFEGLGLAEISPELKQRSLNMGAATQKALGQARTALQHDLDALTLPVGAPR